MGVYSQNDCAAEKREGSVPLAVLAMEDAVNVLEKVFGCLRDRLQPVLLEETKTVEQGHPSSKECKQSCKLAGDLDAQEARIRRLIREVEVVTGHLEI